MKAILTSDTHFGFNESTQAKHRRFWTKIAKEKPDVIFHAGDWICNKQPQLVATLRQLREYVPYTVPVYAVRGNHDFWQQMDDKYHKPWPLGQVLQQHAIEFDKYNITLLDGDFVKLTPTILLRGYDGWYTSVDAAHRPSNDLKHLPRLVTDVGAEQWLSYRAWCQLNDILTPIPPEMTVVTVTHFPASDDIPTMGSNPRWQEQLIETSDYLLTGHSHRAKDETIDGCRHLNCGSDYNDPKYVVFEIEE